MRISSYLKHGEGIWWKREQDGVRLFDSDNDPSSHSEDPCLLHFCSTTFPDIYRQASQDWHFILQQTLPLPSPHIHFYDTDGNFEKTASLPPHPSVDLQHDVSLPPHPSVDLQHNASLPPHPSVGAIGIPLQQDTSLLPVEAMGAPWQHDKGLSSHTLEEATHMAEQTPVHSKVLVPANLFPSIQCSSSTSSPAFTKYTMAEGKHVAISLECNIYVDALVMTMECYRQRLHTC